MTKEKLEKIIILGLVLILSFSLASSQEKKALSFEHFIKIKRMSDPQLSPDGKQIAFVLTTMDLKDKKGNSDIWLVPSTGGQPICLVSSPQADFFPRWSPDGKNLAFIFNSKWHSSTMDNSRSRRRS
jgi:Periplasmic component of the Tol biopolymer transport system